MLKGLVTMSAIEVERLAVIQRVQEGRLTQVKAAELLGLSSRQLRRLQVAHGRLGPSGLVSKRRGRPSNNAMASGLAEAAMALVRERYADFGPTLAAEKLAELHSLRVSRETLRKWMVAAGLWTSRRARAVQVHQPRSRRECLGELVQIDGSEHPWFEDRGQPCTLLVFVDDATSRLMELRFVASESTFDYFESTKAYLRRHGKPTAFYSDKHSIFRVAREGTTGRGAGISQFGRALGQLGIDIICANTAQAKGRVERMNRTLQDRLVKELRLRGICNTSDGNAFLPAFTEDFNRRFARPARNPLDAHRPLQDGESLEQIFAWRETRTMSRDLVVHYKRTTYLVQATQETRRLAGSKRQVEVLESADGQIEIQHQGRSLPYLIYGQQPSISPGEIVENKRLGAALSAIQASHDLRDAKRLASRRTTLRQKDAIQRARAEAALPPVPTTPTTLHPVAAYMADFAEEQRLKRKRHNDVTNERKRQRQVAASLARTVDQPLPDRTFLLSQEADIST
jgi:hypothetical protein